MALKKSISFSSDEKAREILFSWWKNLDSNRKDRASLRHCHGIGEVAFSSSFHNLKTSLQKEEFYVDNEGLATVAGVLSHVSDLDSTGSFASQMAAPGKEGSSSRVSELRFKRLITISSRADMYQPMIRAVKLLKGSVNIFDLANGCYWWNDYTKKPWAERYYSAQNTNSQ